MNTTTTFDRPWDHDLMRWENEGGSLGVQANDTADYERIMRTHSQRLFRIARSIVPNDDKAEAVLEETYVRGLRQGVPAADPRELSQRLMRLAVQEAQHAQRTIASASAGKPA